MQPQTQPLLWLMLFASGSTSLIYQIAWVRALAIGFGNTTYAVSTVLTVYMAGLACGYHGFGRRADHHRAPLRVYAVLELAVGVWAGLLACGLPAINHWTLSLTAAHPRLSTVLPLLVSFVCLLPPCTLLGGTLPVLSRISISRVSSRGGSLSRLYAFNTLGAVAGCLAAGLVLIRHIGLTRSMLLAAATNAVLALMAWSLSQRLSGVPQPQTDGGDITPPNITPPDITSPDNASQPPPAAHRATPGWLNRSVLEIHIVALASGWLLLATEVVWTRLFANLLTGNVLVFSTIVAGFLTGMGLVSLWLAGRVDRWTRHGPIVAVCLLSSGGWLTASVLAQDQLAQLFARLQSATSSGFASLATLYVITAVAAATLGAVTPVLIRFSNRSRDSAGRDLGRLFAINTTGAILGSFTSGFIMLPVLGVNLSLLVMASIYILLATALATTRVVRTLAVLAVCGQVLLLFNPRWYQPGFWYNGGFTAVSKIAPSEVLMFREGVEGTGGVSRHGGVLSLSVNGTVVADSSRHDLWDLMLKAHLPMLLHDNPQSVALVGLGAGISLGAVQSYDVQRVDCVEISEDVVDAQRFFSGFHDSPLRSPQVHLWIDDGRHFLSSTNQRYDVISVDPVDPPICNQYTQEFFAVCRQRLNHGGLMVQWVPLFHLETRHLRIITHTFLKAFPQSTLWYDGTSMLLIGSHGKPLQIDLDRMARRFQSPGVQANLARIQRPPLLLLLSTFLAGPQPLREFAAKLPLTNTDDRPVLEYSLLLEPRPTQQSYASNLATLLPLREPVEGLIAPGQAVAADVRRELNRHRRILNACAQVRIHRLRSEFVEAEALRKSLMDQFGLTETDVRLYQAFLD